MDEKLLQALQDYVATANSGKYKTVKELNSKFPELKGYDAQVLQDYVATANSGKYKTVDELNSKFPEFNVGKQNAVSSRGSKSTAVTSTEPSQPSPTNIKSFDEFTRYYDKDPSDKLYNIKRAYEIYKSNPSEFENPETGMASKERDGWHFSTVDPITNKFLKHKNHPTVQKEINWYNSKDAESFRKDYELDKGGDYYRYIKRNNIVTNPFGGQTQEQFIGADNARRIKSESAKPKKLTLNIPKQPKPTGIEVINRDLAEKRAQKIEEKGTDVLNSLAVGLNQTYSGLAKIPRYVYEVASIPQNLLANAVENAAGEDLLAGIRTNSKSYDSLLASSPLASSPLTALDKLGDFYQNQSEDYQAKQVKYDKGIFDSFANGNLGEAGAQLVNNIAQSAPSMLLMAGTSGIGTAGKLGSVNRTLLNALPFASSKANEIRDDETIPEAIKPIYSGLFGLAEVVYDQSFGTQAIINKLTNTFAESGREVAEKEAKDIATGYLRTAFNKIKEPLSDIRNNAIEEGVTQLSQNILTKLVEDPNKDLMEGVYDALIVGGATGGVLGSVNTVIKSATKSSIEQKNQQIENLSKDLDNPDIDETSKEIIIDKIGAIKEEIVGELTVEKEIFDKLPEAQKEEALEVVARKNTVENSLANPNISEDTKATLTEESKVLDNRLNEITKTTESNREQLLQIINDESIPADSNVKFDAQQALNKLDEITNTPNNKNLRDYIRERTSPSPNWKYNPDLSEGEQILQEKRDELLVNGGENVFGHGMVKQGAGGQINALLDILENGTDPSRNNGVLYTAPIVVSEENRGSGAGTGSSGGTAYLDGSFIIVQREGANGITSKEDIAGVLINDAVLEAMPELTQRLREVYPNLIIEPYSRSVELVKVFNQRKNNPTEVNREQLLQKQLEKLDSQEVLPTQEVINIPEVGEVVTSEKLTNKDKAKQVADWVRTLKSGQDPRQNLGSGDIVGVVNFFRDGALETVATVIEAGGSIADGISSAVNYIREQQLTNNEEQTSIEELRPVVAKELLGIREVETKTTQQKINEQTGAKRTPKETPLKNARKEGKYEGQLQYGEKLAKAKEQLSNFRKETAKKIKSIRESNRKDKSEAIAKVKETLNNKVEELKVVYGQTINELKETIRERVNEERVKAKEQLSDYKTQQATIRDVVSEIKGEIGRLITQAKKDGVLKGNIKAFKATNLFNILNNATTPLQAIKALEYAEKYIKDVEYDNKIIKGRTLQNKIKTLSKRKGVPVDLKQTLSDISKVNLNSIEDIDGSLEVLDRLANLLTRPFVRGNQEAQNVIGKAQEIVKQYNKQKAEEVANELRNAGVAQQDIVLLTEAQQGTLLQKLENEIGGEVDENGNETPIKDRVADKYRETAKTLQSLIDEYVDTSEMTEQQRVDVEAIKQLDIDKVSERNLSQLVFGLTNLVNANKTTGLGRIVITDRVIKNSENTQLISRVKNNIRDATNFFTKRFQRFRTGSNKIANAIISEREVGATNSIFGLTDFKLKSIDYNNDKTRITDKFQKLREKYAKAFKDPVKSMMLSIYADAVQFKQSMTPEEILSEYNNRIIAWGKSLDKLKRKSEQSTIFEKDNRIFIQNATIALDRIASFERDSDGNIESANIKLNKDKLFQELGKPHQEYYNAMREAYDASKQDYFRVSEYFNNKELDSDIENYIFRGYRELTQPQSDLTLDATNEAKRLKANASGSSEGRSNWGQSLPSNSVLDFDVMGRFESDISRMLYDIHTLEARLYAAQATDVRSSPIVEKLNTSDIAETYNEILELATQQDAFQFGGNSVNRGTLLNIWGNINKLGVAVALGGVGQFAKQSTPIIDTAIRLKNPLNAIEGIKNVMFPSSDVNKVLSYANVSTRDIVKDNTPINVDVKKYNANVGNLTKLLRQLGATTEDVIELTSKLSLKPLQVTDKTVAKASWLSFYIDHLKDNNKAVDFSKLDRDALDYADLMTSNVNNESDPRFKAAITKDKYFTTFLPFMSFAINSKMDLLNSLSKIGNGNSSDVTRNIIGNATGIIAYNTVAWGFRAAMAASAISIASTLIASYTDDEEEQKRLQEILVKREQEKSETNYINYKKYLIRDILFANIGSQAIDLAVNPATDFLIEQTTNEEIYKAYQKNNAYQYRPNDYEKAIAYTGVAAPFFSRLGDAYKFVNEVSETDDEFIKKRKGGVNAEGTEIIVDDYYSTEKGIKENARPNVSKNIDMLSMLSTVVSLTGASYQEVSTMKRNLNSIDKDFVEILRGKGTDKEKALKEYLNTSKIKVDGVDYDLSEQMQSKLSTYTQEAVKQLKKETDFKDYKEVMTKTEYESEIGKLAKQTAKDRFISENQDFFDKESPAKKVDKSKEKVLEFQNKQN